MGRLEHLRTFLDVYRLASFTAAARSLDLTQPAVSAHIGALEQLVGKPLFERLPRGVAPTPVADELARAVSPHLDALETRLASYRAGAESGGTLWLAAPPDFIHAALGEAAQTMLEGGYRLRIRTGDRERLYELLTSASVDFAITASLPDEQTCGFETLRIERYLFVAAPALAQHLGNPPSARQLHEHPLIAFDEDLPLIRQAWMELFGQPPSLQADITVPDLRVIRELVVAGQGWSVLPDYQCTEALAHGHLVTLTPQQHTPTNALYLVWNKHHLRTPRLTHARDLLWQSLRQRSK
ncbi:MAG TPA: LysR family transcriptional regulator [Alicycliphilus sp.]|nr:LysR family transcriptional regulator [Alicycliphilus sp.]